MQKIPMIFMLLLTVVEWSPLPIVTFAVAPEVQEVDIVAKAVRSCVALATIASYAPKFKSVLLIVHDPLMLAEILISDVDEAG